MARGRKPKDAVAARRKLNVEAVAGRLGVSEPMARKLIRERRLASYKVGTRVLVDEADLKRFEDSCRIEAAS